MGWDLPTRVILMSRFLIDITLNPQQNNKKTITTFCAGYLRREDGKNWGCWRWTWTSKVQWGFFNFHIPSEMIISKYFIVGISTFLLWILQCLKLSKILKSLFVFKICVLSNYTNFVRLQILLVLKKWHLRFKYHYTEKVSCTLI